MPRILQPVKSRKNIIKHFDNCASRFASNDRDLEAVAAAFVDTDDDRYATIQNLRLLNDHLKAVFADTRTVI